MTESAGEVGVSDDDAIVVDGKRLAGVTTERAEVDHRIRGKQSDVRGAARAGHHDEERDDKR